MCPRKVTENRCKHCARTFARAEHRIRHEHTKEKPFLCSRCPQSFARRDLLTRHAKRNHESELGEADGTARSNSPQQSHSPLEQRFHPTGGIVMPASDQASLLQTPMSQTSNLEAVSWSPDPPFCSDYSLNTTMHRYVIPADMAWPDDVSASAAIPDLDMASIRQLFFPSDQQTLHDPIDPSEGTGPPNEDGQSILSRVGSPAPVSTQDQGHAVAFEHQSDSTGVFTVSERYRQFVQQQADWVVGNAVQIPNRAALARFVQVYFRTFHRHQPFLHEATWESESVAVPLFLSVCANGALYSLEIDTAFHLYTIASKLVEEDDSGLSTLQALMLVIAFAAWSGNLREIEQALRLQSRLSTLLPSCWANHQAADKDIPGSWESWLEHERLQRVTSCLFTLCNLMTLAYDFPSPVHLEARQGLPCKEALWNAHTQADWTLKSSRQPSGRQWASVEAVVTALGDPAAPCPHGIGMFGCHVVISTLLQKIILFRRSCSSSFPGFAHMRQHYIFSLRKWQTMWGHEPEATLSPNHPAGPILFNCTALLRVAYIRLVVDFAPLRSLFGWTDEVQAIERRLEDMEPIKRNSYKTRAVLHACLALKVPVSLGFEVTARTAFWAWSVQHALCYFECALLLARWLLVVQNASDLTSEEHKVLELVVDVIDASQRSNTSVEQDTDLAVAVLHRWARLLNTGPVTVWKMLPKMAGVLTYYAERLSERQACGHS